MLLTKHREQSKCALKTTEYVTISASTTHSPHFVKTDYHPIRELIYSWS